MHLDLMFRNPLLGDGWRRRNGADRDSCGEGDA
jgi:hypothetical protein